jgi:HSP20 family protein
MTSMCFDPFRELDRWTEQALAGSRGVRTVPVHALRRCDRFLVSLDLPGIGDEGIDLTVELERVLTVLPRARDRELPS